MNIEPMPPGQSSENSDLFYDLFQKGIAALDLAEFEEAIEAFERVAVEDSSDSRAWFYLGLCYLETGQGENAIEALNRAIVANPEYSDAHYLLGTAVGSVGQIDRAVECYRRALDIDPHHQKAEEFLIRAEALIASRVHYRQAMRLMYQEPRDANWINLAARELLHSVAIFDASPAKGEFAHLAVQIGETGKKATIERPSDDDGPFWASAVKRAEQAMARRSWPEAASAYHEALDLSPDHAFIHHALGRIYFALGDVDGGIKAWQQAFDLDSDFDFSACPVLSE
jgi:tetratricopeptide (TPR) repeat protein